ncbi:MAG: hypothetical protein AAGI38_13465 [Bacteroidota bacterium]
MRTLLYLIVVFNCSLCISQDIRNELPQSFPPHDFGIDLQTIQGDSFADSVARTETSGYMFIPEFHIGRSPSKLRYERSLWLNEPVENLLNESLFLAVTFPFGIPKSLKQEFRYSLKGISIYKSFGFDDEEIYADPEWQSEISDTVIYEIPLKDLLVNGEDGSYKVVIDTLARVDSKGRYFVGPSFYQRLFYFEISIHRDPFTDDYGASRPVLIVDGQVYHPGDIISDTSEVFVSVAVSPNFSHRFPDEQTYQLRGVRILEKQQIGVREVYKTNKTSNWEKAPQIRIPINELEQTFLAEYVLEVAKIYRRSASGVRYSNPSYKVTKSIYFRKKWIRK